MEREQELLRFIGYGSDYTLINPDDLGESDPSAEKSDENRVYVDSVHEVPDGKVAQAEVDDEGDTQRLYYTQ